MGLPGQIADQVVERIRGTLTEDSHGNSIRDWSNADVLEIDGCLIGPQSGVEFRDGRQTVVTELGWWGPEDADVVETDRIRDPETGILYEISGAILPQRGIRGVLLSHKQAQIQVINE